MTHRERFHRVFTFQPVDRIPLYYFGTWTETKQRWIDEGYDGPFAQTYDKAPQLPGMDPEWEGDLWCVQRLVRLGAIGDVKQEIIEDAEEHRIIRDNLGNVKLIKKNGTAILENPFCAA